MNLHFYIKKLVAYREEEENVCSFVSMPFAPCSQEVRITLKKFFFRHFPDKLILIMSQDSYVLKIDLCECEMSLVRHSFLFQPGIFKLFAAVQITFHYIHFANFSLGESVEKVC